MCGRCSRSVIAILNSGFCCDFTTSTESHGGALVNLIHSYTDNGDPFVRKFTDELLEEVRSLYCLSYFFTHYSLQVSRPFFATLHKWLFSGELYDPFEEFFVSADSSLGHLNYVHPSSIPGGINSLSNDGGFGGGFNGDNDDFSGLRGNGQKLWEAKYRFRKDMLPMFVGEPFGKKVSYWSFVPSPSLILFERSFQRARA